MLQVSLFDARRNVVRNVTPAEAAGQLDELLALPWRSASLRTLTQDTSVQITRGGAAIVSSRASSAPRVVVTSHDRPKTTPLPRDSLFLHAAGIVTPDGHVRADSASKYTQINEFIKLMEHTGELASLAGRGRPVRLLDCGCGAALLTLAAHSLLVERYGAEVELTGIDVNAELISKCTALTEQLGVAHARFIPCAISSYCPPSPPDVVLALHACDTASDDALALAVRAGAPIILAAPCCHKQLQAQMRRGQADPPAGTAALLRHGVLRQRLADALTDAARAAALRALGYSASVIEFVPGEHTPRNLLIRAVLRADVAAHRADAGVSRDAGEAGARGADLTLAQHNDGATTLDDDVSARHSDADANVDARLTHADVAARDSCADADPAACHTVADVAVPHHTDMVARESEDVLARLPVASPAEAATAGDMDEAGVGAARVVAAALLATAVVAAPAAAAAAADALAELDELSAQWGVVPYITVLLKEELDALRAVLPPRSELVEVGSGWAQQSV